MHAGHSECINILISSNSEVNAVDNQVCVYVSVCLSVCLSHCTYILGLYAHCLHIYMHL